MGGLFGVVSKEDCVLDVFYGTDYHSHLGTSRGGMAVWGKKGFTRAIHSIENSPFRTKFENDVPKMAGNMGIGCISDTEAQPLLIRSHLGHYAIATVGRINNVQQLVDQAFRSGTAHFSEMGGGEINPTELVAALVDQGATFEEGIRRAQEAAVTGYDRGHRPAQRGLHILLGRSRMMGTQMGAAPPSWAIWPRLG